MCVTIIIRKNAMNLKKNMVRAGEVRRKNKNYGYIEKLLNIHKILNKKI